MTASHLLKKASSEQEFEQQEQAVKVLREKIEKFGMDFADAVRLESDDAGNDGNLGTFGKFGRMVPEFEQAASEFSLAEGELSQPVRTQFGWHLILLRERNPSKVTLPL